MAASTLAVLRAGLDQAALARLVIDAEDTAFARGWHPPLAD